MSESIPWNIVKNITEMVNKTVLGHHVVKHSMQTEEADPKGPQTHVYAYEVGDYFVTLTAKITPKVK